jgi:hypothetical protein
MIARYDTESYEIDGAINQLTKLSTIDQTRRVANKGTPPHLMVYDNMSALGTRMYRNSLCLGCISRERLLAQHMLTRVQTRKRNFALRARRNSHVYKVNIRRVDYVPVRVCSASARATLYYGIALCRIDVIGPYDTYSESVVDRQVGALHDLPTPNDSDTQPLVGSTH